MRISFILPTVSMGGGIRVVAIYAKALVQKGHDVVVISPPSQEVTIKRKIKSLITGHGWPKSRLNPSHLNGLGLDHRVLDYWRPVIDSDVPDADIVVATWWETAEWVNALSASKGAKIYFIQHHEVHEYLPVDRSRATYRLPLHKVVIAKWLQNVMRAEYGDADVDLVPNGVDHNHFFSGVRGKQPVPTVGFLYSPSNYKGVDVTVQVINNLRVIFPNLRVIVFGAYKPEEEEAFYDRTEFYYSPPQDKIRDIYAQCDVWITASRSEGFNLPAMEAMACRTPVVSTKAGWPEEAVVTSRNGVLVDVDDVHALTQGAALILALSDEEWREMSNNAYLTVASSSWQESANQFERVLVRAYQQSRNPGDKACS